MLDNKVCKTFYVLILYHMAKVLEVLVIPVIDHCFKKSAWICSNNGLLLTSLASYLYRHIMSWWGQMGIFQCTIRCNTRDLFWSKSFILSVLMLINDIYHYIQTLLIADHINIFWSGINCDSRTTTSLWFLVDLILSLNMIIKCRIMSWWRGI